MNNRKGMFHRGFGLADYLQTINAFYIDIELGTTSGMSTDENYPSIFIFIYL